MRKTMHSFIVVAFLVFVMFTLGGCGGSSNNFKQGGSNDDVSSETASLLAGSDMVPVMNTSEWHDMINEFEEAGSGDKMNPQKWVYCITDEEADILRKKYADSEAELTVLEALLFNAEDIKRNYDDEHIILLLYPDEDFINRTLEAAGLEGNFVLTSEEAPSGRLEMFAISKRTVNERTHTFTYRAARSDATTISDDTSAPSTDGGEVIVSGDVAYVVDENGNILSSSDVTTKDKEETPGINDENGELFNVNRWRNYYNWCASIADWAEEQSAEASSIEMYSAAIEGDLTKIAEAQTETIDCSINIPGYMPWGNINYCDAVDVKRTNSVSFIIYSCHSFTTGSDYYLVKANARTATNYYQDRVVYFTWGDDSFNNGSKGWIDITANMGGHKDPVNYLSGFTKSMTIYAAIHNGQPKIIDNTPKNAAKETDYSYNLGWNIGGTIGGSKDGASGSLTGGVSYSETKSFKTKKYNITNALNLFDPSWVLSYSDGISEGSWNVKGLYLGINPPEQSTESVELECGWIWEIEKSVWGKAGKTLTMGLDFWSQEGFAFGRGSSITPLYGWDTQEKYPYLPSRHTITLKAPAHYWLSQRTFTFPQDGGAADFELLAEYDWTVKVSGDVKWVTTSEQSGNPTGANKRGFMVEVKPNTTGKIRIADIIFEMTYNGHTESNDIQITQGTR
ncbi:MAG: leukocidin family pore-forming toxin [Synergistaceae bacterium]|nr:leukocidin family pore-forming toxin [Synergistaceae bacterium]